MTSPAHRAAMKQVVAEERARIAKDRLEDRAANKERELEDRVATLEQELADARELRELLAERTAYMEDWAENMGEYRSEDDWADSYPEDARRLRALEQSECYGS